MKPEHLEISLDQQSIITPTLFKLHTAASQESADADDFDDGKLELLLILQLAEQAFERGDTAGAVVERLIERLHMLRRKSKPATWEKLSTLAREHSVSAYLLQDPMTKWSFDKSRGYSGDAGLIDLIYGHDSTKGMVEAATELGRAIYAQTYAAPTCVAARERRDLLASLVAEAAERTRNAEILAVACGHLREAEITSAADEGTIKRWVALDQDPTSIAIVNEAQKDRDVIQTMKGSVAGLIRRSYDLGTFDLIYAAGLYDYLSREVAIRLTQRIMELVKPGGEYLFANFSDITATDGYMESFMNWPLILRSEEEMWDIINASVDRNLVDVEMFQSDNGYLYYAKIRRKS
jgi:hypothetical protein